MNHTFRFNEAVKTEMTATLATSAGGSVTMRLVSPVYYNGSILIFTAADSVKYKQLRKNPRCCPSVGGFFAEATAEFFGSTLLDGNQAMREAYAGKFPGAFDSGVEFGGRAAEFILLRPTRLSGGTYEVL